MVMNLFLLRYGAKYFGDGNGEAYKFLVLKKHYWCCKNWYCFFWGRSNYHRRRKIWKADGSSVYSRVASFSSTWISVQWLVNLTNWLSFLKRASFGLFCCLIYNIASCLELGVACGVTKRGSTLQLDTCEWRHHSLLDWRVELIVAESYSEVQLESYVLLKDGAYYCYCAYALRISRYSDFQSPMLTNTGICLRGLKLSGESRS